MDCYAELSKLSPLITNCQTLGSGCHSKCQRAKVYGRWWRACNLSFALTVLYNLLWTCRLGWFRNTEKRICVSSLTPVWYHLPSLWAADCHTVLRLWLMNLPVALYLRRLFHSGARWWQGLRTHKDMYNPEGNPYLSTGHSQLPPFPTLFYNFCCLFARGLGCHYAVQCLGLQAFTLWFGERILSLKHEGIKCGLILFA